MKTDCRNKFFCIFYSIILLFILFNSAMAENWPCFRGPTVEWSQTSNIAWKTQISGIGWSSPIVFDDRVFVTTATDEGAYFDFYALTGGLEKFFGTNRYTGKIRDTSSSLIRMLRPRR